MIRSVFVLRALAALITFASFGGMTAFAATHVQNAGAPLKPAVVAATAATPAPVRTRQRSSASVPLTTQIPLTRTHVS